MNARRNTTPRSRQDRRAFAPIQRHHAELGDRPALLRERRFFISGSSPPGSTAKRAGTASEALCSGSSPRRSAAVGQTVGLITLSRRTSAVDKARECRTGRSQFKRAERSPRRLCGGPSGATVPARLGVAFLGKGATIPGETRLDSRRHSDSEFYQTDRLAHPISGSSRSQNHSSRGTSAFLATNQAVMSQNQFP